MRKVPLSMLTPDMCLAKPIYHNNMLLLKEGTPDLSRFADSLMKIGIFHIFVKDEVSEGIEIQDVISDETRLRCKSILQDTFRRLTTEGALNINLLNDTIDSLLAEILSQENILLSLNDIGATDDSTLIHSINATVFSLMIGKKLGYSPKRLKKLAEGTLLHDIGKTLIDQKTLFKTSRLTTSEFQHIKNHPVLGYKVLKKSSSLTELSRIIALYHHERLDGSGYPNGLKGNEIHEFARVAAIADVYDALTAERCYRKSMPPYAAIQILMQESSTKLDASITALFIQNLAVFPNGTTVRLSDNNYGIVKAQNPSMPLRPIVRVLQKSQNQHLIAFEVDLMKELHLTIVEPTIDTVKP